jgi:hypothetical protein
MTLMAQDASKVRVGVTGAVYVAPSGTTLPTDASVDRNAAFVDVGFIAEDGVTETQNTSVENIKAWQRGAVVRKAQTEHDLEYSFGMLETNDTVLQVYYGNALTGTVEITGEELPRQAWVLEVEDGDELLRIVLPDAQVTEHEDITYANSEAVARGVTLTAYPDTDGVKAYLYVKQPPPPVG